MESLIERLSAVCREHLVCEKIIVVPSLAIGHQISDAVAFGGTNWINLRSETLRTIADAVVSAELAAEGVTVLSRAQSLALIERACDRVLTDESYFGALRDRVGLHRAIQRSIDDLRLAGLRGQLPEGAFEEEQKARELDLILSEYEAELQERNLIDRCGVVARAIARLESGVRGPWAEDAVWIVADELELANEESRLVTLASRGAAKVRIAGARDESATIPDLGDAAFVRAVGEENEIRGALRAVIGSGARFDDAELVYTTSDPYLALAYELCSEYGIDATYAQGISVSFTRPGQACLAFLRWVAGGWQAADLIAAARSSVLKTFVDGDRELSPQKLARLLRASAIGWGRDRYVPRLEAYAATHESTADDETQSESRRRFARDEASHARVAIAAMREVLASSEPVASGEEFSANALARAAKAFVDRFADARGELNAMALAALRQMLDELAELPEDAVGRGEACRRLHDAVVALSTSASNPRPGHLHVAPLRSAGWSQRTRLFVVGLDESKFPGAGLQDPIVLDAERSALNESITPRRLPLRGEAPLRAAEALRRCLARRPGARWTFSYSSIDLREQRERFPANDLLDIYRRASGNARATYEDFRGDSSVAGFLDDSAPLSAAEWWLEQRFVTQRADYADALEREYPLLARGRTAEDARSSDAITAWDGLVDTGSLSLDPRKSGRELSASQIEKMAGCPYGWFLRYQLRIEVPDDVVYDPERWLDARLLGLLLHEIFEHALTELCAAGERPSLDRHLARMQAIAEQKLAEYRSKVPPPNEAAYLRQRDEVMETCETFLRVEQNFCATAQPMYFEAAFGFKDAASMPLGMTEPLEIALAGGSVRLRGRIDRIDRNDDGTWSLWDYKTGGLYPWRGSWQFAAGTKVQHAIYARSLTEMLRRRGIDADPEIAESGYYFPTPKGGGERKQPELRVSDLDDALNRTFDVIGSGFFPHPDEESACRFCEYAAICGGADAAVARAQRKHAANAGDPVMRAWQRLREVK